MQNFIGNETTRTNRCLNDIFMNWKTIYIIGKEDFRDEVMKNLSRSGLEYMSGYDSDQSKEAHELIWVPETMTLRELKMAIGAKTVFKYRLGFFESLEQFIERLNNDEFTEDEKKRVERMRLLDSAA